MLIGLPASGKSTFSGLVGTGKAVRVSADDYIEEVAALTGKTYDEVWDKKSYKNAEAYARDRLLYAIENGLDVVWDQTNLTAKSRAKKLANIPKDYVKVALVFKVRYNADHEERLASRPGKTIPHSVMKSMLHSYEQPTAAEGFDYVYEIFT
jgi:tRNA uridine 5-carbamoylmethylation protein Kti12